MSSGERLTIPKGENRRIASEVLGERLQRASISLQNLYQRESFDRAWQILGDENVQKQFYRTSQSRVRFNSVYLEADQDESVSASCGLPGDQGGQMME